CPGVRELVGADDPVRNGNAAIGHDEYVGEFEVAYEVIGGVLPADRLLLLPRTKQLRRRRPLLVHAASDGFAAKAVNEVEVVEHHVGVVDGSLAELCWEGDLDPQGESNAFECDLGIYRATLPKLVQSRRSKVPTLHWSAHVPDSELSASSARRSVMVFLISASVSKKSSTVAS